MLIVNQVFASLDIKEIRHFSFLTQTYHEFPNSSRGTIFPSHTSLIPGRKANFKGGYQILYPCKKKTRDSIYLDTFPQNRKFLHNTKFSEKAPVNLPAS